MNNSIEVKRTQAIQQYHKLVQNILTNVIEVGPKSVEKAFVVLNCCNQQEAIAIFYYQQHWVSTEQLINKEAIDNLLAQGPQIIAEIAKLFKDVAIADYAFIQWCYNYNTDEWQSHFVWQDELLENKLSLNRFVAQWQLRLEKDFNQW